MNKTKGLRVAVLLIVLALVAAACSSDDGSDGSGGGDGDTYTIGISNNTVGNGWREQMICAMKAEARARGNVDEVVLHPTDEIQADGFGGNAADAVHAVAQSLGIVMD